MATAEVGVIDTWLDRGLLPDVIVRAGIRRISAGRLREQAAGGPLATAARQEQLIADLWRGPIAVATEAANAQHYEVPQAFYALVLGPHLKYSSGLWEAGTSSLAEAELAMLQLSAARAQVAEGQRILDLGCGWGAMTLHLAATLPESRIVGVSNSASQRAAILARAQARGLTNVEIVTANIETFEPAGTFDRIISVEMLEHVRNHQAVFARLARWLTPDGRLFIHVFSHREFTYPFEAQGEGDWMARHFFTGGMMPGHDLFLRLQGALLNDGHWRLDGRHYQKTAEAWLVNMDANREAVDRVLAATYGPDQLVAWRARWRTFFLACAEMFGYREGSEWGLSHYTFVREKQR